MKKSAWEGKNGDNWKYTFSGYDTKAYYSYLPDFFIKHNLTITDSTLPYVNVTANGVFNKHFVGPAVLWSPFFIMAMEYSKLKNRPTDGYSALFAKSIGIAALFWLFIGLYFLWKILELFNIRTDIISFTILLITFGTNFFYYASLQYMMAHLYSFSLLAVSIYAGMKYSSTNKAKYLILLCIAFGLSIIVRPTVIALLPFILPLMSGSLRRMIQVFFNIRSVIIAIIIITPIILLQCGVWYMQTGHWFIRAYSDEGFYFLHPRIFKILFSFENGWFIYTPIAFISLFGFLHLYKKNRAIFFCCFGAIIIWIYMVASWWCWSYADGFEHRAFIDIYPIVAIGTAHLFPTGNSNVYNLLSPLKRKFVMGGLLVVCGLCLSLNIIQTYQFCNNILPTYWMDWNSYKYVFLKTSDKYIGCLGGHKDLTPYSRIAPQLVFSSCIKFDQPIAGWECKGLEMINGKPAIHFNGDEFGTSVVIPSDSLYSRGRRYYTKITLTRFEPIGNSSSGALLINDVVGADNKHEQYQSIVINDYPSGKDSNTRTFHYQLDTPYLTHKNSKMYFYIWNKDHQNFYLTNLSIEIYRYLP